jgi:hypothetical protein
MIKFLLKATYFKGLNYYDSSCLYTELLLLSKQLLNILKQLINTKGESFEKCSFLFKFKEGENFNYRNTLSILRIKI